MNKEVLKQVDDYLKTSNETLLYKAMLFELTSQYNYIKEDYTDFDDVDLTLEDLKSITTDIMDTVYLNEELMNMVSYHLNNYVNSKQ